ncbi:MAG: hypothetical protein EAS51_07540 [Microbacteriaceae bacterium]|nr:MAG: hypothetical protein EAS51_07540 [Microbacteriaceae bacterium]
MTEVRGGDSPRDDADGTTPGFVPAAAEYPPPYGGASTVSDDELAAALAAQTAMYTGPITLPVLNSDPVFRPDPGEVKADVPPPAAAEPALPPVPVPPPPPAPEYIAPDVVASDPEAAPDSVVTAADPVLPEPVADWPAPSEFTGPVEVAAVDAPVVDAPAPAAAPSEPPAPAYVPPAPAFEAPAAEVPAAEVPAAEVPAADAPVAEAPPTVFVYGDTPPAVPAAASAPAVEPSAPEAPLADEDLGRTIEQEAAHGSTLDAILRLEDELRRRQGLPPTEETGEPPAEAGAVFGTAQFGTTPPAPPAPETAYSAPPGWVDAPDPAREGEALDAFAPSAPQDAAPSAWDLGPSQPTDAPAAPYGDLASYPPPIAPQDAALTAPVDDVPVYELPDDETASGGPVFAAPDVDAPASDAPASVDAPYPGPETPVSLADAPPPAYESPAPAFAPPASAFAPPAPTYDAPAPAYESPAPDLQPPAAEPTAFDAPAFGGTTPPTVSEPPFATPDAPSPGDQAWLTAPPPAYAPPPLVEPPAPEPAVLDTSALTPPPVSDLPAPVFPPPDSAVDPGAPVDFSQLPPPSAASAAPAPGDFHDAPPPSAEAIVLTGAPAPYPGDPEVEGIDELDRADLAAPIPVDEAGVASVAPVPLSTATVVAVGEPLPPEAPTDLPAMAVEASASEPTPIERRAGHAARLFWLWFAANSSVVMLAVGASLFALGMSLRQVLVAIVAGVAVSALPLGLGSLAGKWSGQPTMVVSRATFGLVGNVLPAILSVIGRVLWGGVLLWLLAATAGSLFAPGEGVGVTAFVALAVGAVLAGIVAVLGYGLLHRVQRVLGILSTALLVVVIVFTSSHVDLEAALRTDDGSWLLALGGAVTVFSVVGLAWAQSSSDLARYQNPAGSGAANMLWGSFGAIVPTLAILSWGAVLAASDPGLGESLARAPLAALLDLVPDVLLIPLFAAAAFGLVAGAIVAMYSAGLSIGATGLRAPRAAATVIAAVLVTALGAGLLLIGADTRDIVWDVATTVAVPVAAWTGIFGAEMMIRLRRFHAPSLLERGGVYPAVRWVNLIGLLVITGVGYGLTTAEVAGLTWQGYLFGPLGVDADTPLAGTDIGVLVALGLGLLLPLVAGIPAIRAQERDREEISSAATGSDAAPLID